MKFSIITTSFNQGRFLPDCVESSLSQVGVEFEHIVADAGSTDETLEVLKRYPLIQWTSEPDGGMSDGINREFQRATGDCVMWLNCDDYLLPGALQKVTGHAIAQPDAEVIHGDCVYSGKKDESTGGSRESGESGESSYQCAPFHSKGDMKCMFISGTMG